MFRIALVSLVFAALLVSGCTSKFRTYDGPEVTRVIVLKERRRMYLLHDTTVLRAFDFKLGFTPTGHKTMEGDGRTPEGDYIIDRRNPNSDFHMSVGISYPNAQDVEVARRNGVSPGGDIFIHGTPKLFRRRDEDWTWGCIAVTDREVEDIYAMVKDGTPISIYP